MRQWGREEIVWAGMLVKSFACGRGAGSRRRLCMVPSDSYSYIGFKGEKRWAWEKATSRWTAFYGRSWPLSTTWKNPEHLHRLFDVLPEQTDNM